jgi:hypothetical protein
LSFEEMKKSTILRLRALGFNVFLLLVLAFFIHLVHVFVSLWYKDANRIAFERAQDRISLCRDPVIRPKIQEHCIRDEAWTASSWSYLSEIFRQVGDEHMNHISGFGNFFSWLYSIVMVNVMLLMSWYPGAVFPIILGAAKLVWEVLSSCIFGNLDAAKAATHEERMGEISKNDQSFRSQDDVLLAAPQFPGKAYQISQKQQPAMPGNSEQSAFFI